MTDFLLTDQRATHLACHLKNWRRDRDPAAIPELHRHGRARRHLTQADVGALIGVSDRWYRALESGKPVRVSPELLAGIARVLGLDESQRSTLYLLATGQQPPANKIPVQPRVVPAMTLMLHAQPWPAYVCDVAWNVLACNGHAADLFGWMCRGTNLARWILTAPEARTRLIDWESAWARPMLAQLSLSSSCLPDHPCLKQVVSDVLNDSPTIQRLWDTTPAAYTPADEPRQIRPANEKDPVTVQALTYVPYADRSIHLTLLAPATDHDTHTPHQTPTTIRAPSRHERAIALR